MRLLLTRPQVDSEALVEPLGALGIEAMIEPLLTIRYRKGTPPALDGVQAILVTSANGVRAFAHRSADRSLPVYAVGDASARAAKSAGFKAVESASGDVDDLARRVVARLDAEAGALLHVAGKTVAGELGNHVTAAGYEYRRAVLYEARTAERFTETAARAMTAQQVQGVLFFSPRTAATFARLAKAEGLTEACRRMVAYCLSPTVADRAGVIAWRRVRTAARPDQEAMMAMLRHDQQAAGDGTGQTEIARGLGV